MTTEKSCGAVVFTKENGHVRYIIIESKEGVYGFPKGHIEQAETEIQTALREIKEETGLTVSVIDGFRAEDSYSFTRNGQLITKSVVYFLAEYSDQSPTAQEAELNSVHLMDFEAAISAFQFDGSKEILKQAHTFLAQ